MKHLQRLSFLITFLFLGQAALAQLLPPTNIPPEVLPPFECGIEQITYSTPKSAPCTPSSETWINQYRNPEHWKADSVTPIKTILVNYIVCQNDTGAGWQDIPEFYESIDQMFDQINDWFSNIPGREFPLTCEPQVPHISDSRIRFEFNQAYFLKNTDWYEAGINGSIVSQVLDSLFEIYPEARGQLNHIFTQSTADLTGSEFGAYFGNTQGEAAVQTRWTMFST